MKFNLRSALEDLKAILTKTHVVYTSGKHGDKYINKDAIYPNTEVTSRLCETLAYEFRDNSVEVAIAPAIGGVILSQWVALHLTKMTGREVLGVYAEKDSACFVIRRGYDKLIADKNVLVVEDVLTTGGTARKVIEVTRSCGGRVVGLGALCNRGGITPEDVGNPPKLHSVFNLTFEAWDEADCPLCRDNIPINTDVGKGREFLARKQQT